MSAASLRWLQQGASGWFPLDNWNLTLSACGERGTILLPLTSVFVTKERIRVRRDKGEILVMTWDEYRNVHERKKNLCHFYSLHFSCRSKEAAQVNDADEQLSTWAHAHTGISYLKVHPLKQWPNTMKLKIEWASVSKGMKRGGGTDIKDGGNTEKQRAALRWGSTEHQQSSKVDGVYEVFLQINYFS